MLKAARILLIITLPLVFFLTSLQALVFQEAYFGVQFSRYHIEEATGMEKDDLLFVMGQAMDYLKGARDDLVVISRVGGQEREIFGAREKEHMEDVRHLFLKGFQIRNISLILLLCSLGVLLCKGSREITAKALVWAAWLPLFLATLCSAVIALDFSRYFIIFHEVFFDNDLWILDPEREILIQMLPEGFFMDTALLSAGLFITLSMFTGLAALLYLRGLQPGRRPLPAPPFGR